MPEQSNNSCSLLYCTTPDQTEAERIGQVLVEQQLAACVNILPGMISIYRWENERQHTREAVLLIKTTTANTETVIQRIVELHPYDCPAVFSLSIESGHPEFLEWIQNQINPCQ